MRKDRRSPHSKLRALCAMRFLPCANEVFSL